MGGNCIHTEVGSVGLLEPQLVHSALLNVNLVLALL